MAASLRHTVLLADDHEMFREGLVSLLRRQDHFEVIATATDGREAVDGILSNVPDIAIIDGAMPGLSGIEVMEAVFAEPPENPPSFVLLSMFSHPQLLADAKEAGVSACVSKRDASRELTLALTAIVEGDFFVSSSMRSMMALVDTGEVIGLSQRERQIMHGIVDGMTNKELASLLGIAVKTVGTHRERMMKKIGAHNAADIVRYAMQMGIGLV